MEAGRETFHISAAFILSRVTPAPADLVHGYRGGWLSPEDVIELALAIYETYPTAASLEELALMLPGDVENVPVLLDELLPLIQASAESSDRLWLFLAVDWILEHPDRFDDPLVHIESVWADFGHPPDLGGAIWWVARRSKGDRDDLLDAAADWVTRQRRTFEQRA